MLITITTTEYQRDVMPSNSFNHTLRMHSFVNEWVDKASKLRVLSFNILCVTFHRDNILIPHIAHGISQGENYEHIYNTHNATLPFHCVSNPMWSFSTTNRAFIVCIIDANVESPSSYKCFDVWIRAMVGVMYFMYFMYFMYVFYVKMGCYGKAFYGCVCLF